MTIDETLRSHPGLMPLKKLATLIGVHYQTIYDWARTGSVPHLRVGGRIKFDPTEIADWLKKRSIG